MTAITGTVTSGALLAHQALLPVIRDLATANGWSVLRYNTSSENHELILKGVGYSGTEEIYIGFRTFHSVASDYYNMDVATFTGYVSSNAFVNQPGATINGVCAHNLTIQYWILCSPQRVALGLKVGTPVYEFAYAGKFLPYATPSQYPYPVANIGMLDGAFKALRYSDQSEDHRSGVIGNRNQIDARLPSGANSKSITWPWNADCMASSSSNQRDFNGSYSLNPIILIDDAVGPLGELEGVYHITGYNNAVENTLTINDVVYVVIQDAYRTGFNNYIAMRLS
jgi:hypothetical protein